MVGARAIHIPAEVLRENLVDMVSDKADSQPPGSDPSRISGREDSKG